ncbi:hypothetical protein BDZ88DRAFT_268347 [Geranomyces variabilis]|nr:hypothetical protein BDZ88DRAFT_268347 [Geranomyces variabilis]
MSKIVAIAAAAIACAVVEERPTGQPWASPAVAYVAERSDVSKGYVELTKRGAFRVQRITATLLGQPLCVWRGCRHASAALAAFLFRYRGYSVSASCGAILLERLPYMSFLFFQVVMIVGPKSFRKGAQILLCVSIPHYRLCMIVQAGLYGKSADIDGEARSR